MAELIVRFPDRPPDHFPLGRLRITLGRSARNDLCVPDPFASRVHAEVRREGDEYFLQDLGSANGTLYNGATVQGAVPLTAGGRIQIGETEIVFDDGTYNSSMGATMITDNSSSIPEATIALASGDRTTSGLLEAIEGARTKPEAIVAARSAKQGDLLALISKVGITLLASASLGETLDQIVSLVFEAVPADRCLLMMRDDSSEDLRVAVARLRDRVGEVGEIRVSRNVLDEVVIKGKSVLTSDAQHDPRFASGTVVLQGIRSVLAVPLGVADKVFGIIYADSPIAEGRFTEDHLKLLTTLASVAAIRVENARLLEAQLQTDDSNEKCNSQWKFSSGFNRPRRRLFQVKFRNQFPCYEIGGDYYDFIQRDDGRLVIALGDVSGKGTAAALLMSSLHASVHAQAGSHDTLAETISAVNRYLADNIPSNRFVTLFYAELDPASGSLSFLNAGHNPPLIVHAAGTVEQLASGGLPLGIKRDAEYREGRTQLQMGDVLVIYSDGVTEARVLGEEFGPTRLYEVVSRNIDASAAGVRDRIESALTKFSQGTQAADDITLVIVKRQAETKQIAVGK